jgi:hypothetical protein
MRIVSVNKKQTYALNFADRRYWGLRICKAPGPHHIASIAVQVDVNTGGASTGQER